MSLPGGFVPGLNDVIRSIVLELLLYLRGGQYYRYPLRLPGLYPGQYGHSVIDLTPERVSYIHELGGTILSSSRGQYKIEEIVDALQQLNINILFTIGGDGTLRGAQGISQEIEKRAA